MILIQLKKNNNNKSFLFCRRPMFVPCSLWQILHVFFHYLTDKNNGFLPGFLCCRINMEIILQETNEVTEAFLKRKWKNKP